MRRFRQWGFAVREVVEPTRLRSQNDLARAGGPKACECTTPAGRYAMCPGA